MDVGVGYERAEGGSQSAGEWGRTGRLRDEASKESVDSLTDVKAIVQVSMSV